ncbi:MAG: hypothetical protein FWC64_06905 [Treponema sp.]|nr:hypothetical protein [Treponema sp.]
MIQFNLTEAIAMILADRRKPKLKPHVMGNHVVQRDKDGILYCPTCHGSKGNAVPLQKIGARMIEGNIPVPAYLNCPACDFSCGDPGS